MSGRIWLPLAAFATFLLSALSTGSSLLLLLAVFLLLTLISGAVSVLWAAKTFDLSGEMDAATVHRGDQVTLSLRVRHRGLLPIAPVMLEISSGADGTTRNIFLKDRPGRLQSLSMPFRADHVGRFSPGVHAWQVEDLMGFFHIRRAVTNADFSLLVLPILFKTDPLTLSPGDPGSDAMARATEDLSAPSDIRAYQPGDPM